ncbi:hypothetical protein [Paraglaciecola sp.]|uniref:hypothetical protein n=1 Tax=Paraglaciecola sp. TaxID=1920173 RepID=UPI003EF1E868
MSDKIYKLASNERPDWVEYPHAYCRLIEQNITDITPWHLMDAKEVYSRYKGLSERYLSRKLFPFAFRQDNDDIACWAEGEGEKVLIIHDFASPGWECEGEFESVWSWFRSAIEETIDWD